MSLSTTSAADNPLIARCLIDPAFRDRLLANPASALHNDGFILPPGLEIRVFENTPTVLNIVLPIKTAADDVLTDQQLESIAGGGTFMQDFSNWFNSLFSK